MIQYTHDWDIPLLLASYQTTNNLLRLYPLLPPNNDPLWFSSALPRLAYHQLKRLIYNTNICIFLTNTLFRFRSSWKGKSFLLFFHRILHSNFCCVMGYWNHTQARRRSSFIFKCNFLIPLRPICEYAVEQASGIVCVVNEKVAVSQVYIPQIYFKKHVSLETGVEAELCGDDYLFYLVVENVY